MGLSWLGRALDGVAVFLCRNMVGLHEKKQLGLRTAVDGIAVSIYGNRIGMDEKYNWSPRDGKIEIT